MSLVLDSNTAGNRIERPGFIRGITCIAVYDSPPDSGRFPAGDRLFTAEATDGGGVVRASDQDEADSCSTSSIGRNSNSSDFENDRPDSDGDEEVQSSYKGPLASLDALEEVLPIKRGISKFYAGKSKSFTSLADTVSCSSIKDIVKPENAYSRKRKNLLAYHNFWDKNVYYQSGSGSNGISKRLANSSRYTLAPGNSMNGSENNNREGSTSNSSSPGLSLPPLPPQSRKPPGNEVSPSQLRRNFCSVRSFSLSDLQCAAAAATPSLAFSNQDKVDKPY